MRGMSEQATDLRETSASPLPPKARVLVVRLSALGDVLFALETVASLKAERPDVRIDFLVDERFADLLHGHPEIERVLTSARKNWRGLPGALWRLRNTARYDAVLDLHGILKSALHVACTRAQRKLGYLPPGTREAAHLAYPRRDRVALPSPLPHRADRGRYLLRALGLEGRRVPATLPPPDQPVTVWRSPRRLRLVVHPGTSAFAAFKRWPARHFASLLDRLHHDFGERLDTRIAFGPGERPLAEQINDQLDERVELLDGGALGLRGFAAALAETDVVVAGDTGPLHIAAAAGARIVALFGPKNADLYGPRSAAEATRLLYHPVPCRPCTRRRCASPQCVLGLEVERVHRATTELLQRAADRETETV